MNSAPPRGLIAASITPFCADDNVDLNAIGPMLDRLIDLGISGFYVCGSTYNVAALLYRKIFAAVAAGDLAVAQDLQHHSVELVQVMTGFPFHGALKAMMEMLGMVGGPCRLPLRSLTSEEKDSLRGRLNEIGYFDWCGIDVGAES